MIVSLILDHHQVRQEPPCHPRLLEETWSIGGVLIGFLISNLDENFRKAPQLIVSPLRNHHQVHQEPQCPPRLQEETWGTGGVLTGFLMSNLDENLRKAPQ